mmetsp:Transcript_110230/g.154667  ORF Transcript_110230/g.154667 Transcript_110230/m.154667 type:complete len:163 (-) Transcript_110230:761-1249(-)
MGCKSSKNSAAANPAGNKNANSSTTTAQDGKKETEAPKISPQEQAYLDVKAQLDQDLKAAEAIIGEARVYQNVILNNPKDFEEFLGAEYNASNPSEFILDALELLFTAAQVQFNNEGVTVHELAPFFAIKDMDKLSGGTSNYAERISNTVTYIHTAPTLVGE